MLRDKMLCPWRDWELCFKEKCPYYQYVINEITPTTASIETVCIRAKGIDELKELIKELKNEIAKN